MGRGVEDLSGRCHVKRMSGRKERLGFLCNSVFARKKKERERNAHAARARTRSLAHSGSSPLIICQNASLYKTICIRAAS